MSKIHSEMSIDTPSIPSTVDGVITGNEEDKKNYCCLCKPEDDCQKFCEICLCDWEREYIRNQQLYSGEIIYFLDLKKYKFIFNSSNQF